MSQSLVNPELVDQLVQRQIAQDEKTKSMQMPEPSRGPEPTPLDPKIALLLGQAADSASTYAFLKKGTGREANPALGYMNGRPWSVIPSSIAGAAGYSLLHKFLSKKSPKVANTLAGLVGGFHGALAGANMEDEPGGSFKAALQDFTPKRR